MDEAETPVAVVGQGSLGTLFAVALAEAGHPVTVVSARAKEAEPVELRIAGRRVRQAQVTRAPSFPETPVDLAFVTGRAAQAVDQAREAADHLSKVGLLVGVQNGLVQLDMAEAVGAGRLAPMVVGFNAGMIDDRTVKITSPGGVTLGPMVPVRQDQVEDVAGSLQGTLRAQVTGNPVGAIWSKWTISCAINGLAVVSGHGVGPLSQRKDGRTALLSLVTECVALAEDQGITFERVAGPLSPDTLAGSTTGLGGWFRGLIVRIIGWRYRGVVPSALEAYRDGRDPELDELNGRAAIMADKRGLQSPWNRALSEVAGGILEGEREPGWESFEAMVARARSG